MQLRENFVASNDLFSFLNEIVNIQYMPLIPMARKAHEKKFHILKNPLNPSPNEQLWRC